MMRENCFLRAVLCIWCAGIATCAVAISAAQAVPTQYKMIKELEAEEKAGFAGSLVTRPQYTYTSSGERDPFQALITRDEQKGTVSISDTVEVPPPQMTVQGVIWGGEFPLAIINDQLVKEGDKIGEEVEIVHIEAYGVTFKFNDKEYTVPAPAVQGLSK